MNGILNQVVFLSGTRCPKCQHRSYKKTHEEFIKEVFDLVGNEYTILEEYKTTNDKIRIRHNSKECYFHEYSIRPNDFLKGYKCPKCSKRNKNTMDFIREIKNLVEDEYILMTLYQKNYLNVKMRHNEEKCNYHEFLVTPNSFLRGSRCPVCASSKGEKRVQKYLDLNSIKYIRQYRFKECKDIKTLPFDFAIFNDNKLYCLIEYDGHQHFQAVDHWGGQEGLEKIQRRDKIKNDYCISNNIKLIRIPYWDFDNIEIILSEELKELLNK